jgi:hypothetical protein
MCIRKLIGATDLYAFSALSFGVSILEVSTKQKTVEPLNRFMRGKTVRDLCEYQKGKILCAASYKDRHELWSVDYVN